MWKHPWRSMCCISNWKLFVQPRRDLWVFTILSFFTSLLCLMNDSLSTLSDGLFFKLWLFCPLMFFAAALSVCHFLSMSTDCLCILGSSNANDIVINSADGSTSCSQSTTLNCCSRFTNCSQICVDGTSQVPPADRLFYSKQNKEKVEIIYGKEMQLKIWWIIYQSLCCQL